MRRLILTSALALSSVPTLAHAQVAVDIHIGFPAPPPLVVVSPGVEVVPDYGEEIFFVNGWYWLRRDAVWYRTRDHRGGWVVVPQRGVPVALVRIPPGKYKHWRKEEEKAERRERKAEEKAWKQEAKEERKELKKHHKHDD